MRPIRNHKMTEVEFIANGCKYTTFAATYKILSFMMVVGFLFPTPKMGKIRIPAFILLLLSITPMSIFVCVDMYKSLLARDFVTIIRHGTVFGPLLTIFMKIMLAHMTRSTAQRIIDEMERDYARFNGMPAEYQRIVDASIASNVRYTEKSWTVTVTSGVMTFPVMAAAYNVYSCTATSERRLFMIHDLPTPFGEPDERFASPYFEIMFAYMTYCAVLYVISFTGYDGFFGLCVNHACLKMQVYCQAFEEALRRGDVDAIVEVVKEQNRLFEYIHLIQETFKIWLGVILIATMIQICNCMYYITEGYELDLRYIIFTLAVIVHIYLPCRYSAKLKYMSVETATLIYCAGWENVNAKPLRKTVLFMIARAQIPLEITAFNKFPFDMDLFVSILQTSYSMYTLLRS